MTQKQTLLYALRQGPVSTMDAIKHYGILRASERVRELIADGHDIRTEMVAHTTHSGRKTKYARYHLQGTADLFGRAANE